MSGSKEAPSAPYWHTRSYLLLANPIRVLRDLLLCDTIYSHMSRSTQHTSGITDFLARLADPFTAEALFDCLADMVFFIKDDMGRYLVVNQTLVNRCNLERKDELLDRTAAEIFPGPTGESYLAQDLEVIRTGVPLVNALELHTYPQGAPGWCLTTKLPLLDKSGQCTGLVGFSRDLHAPEEKSKAWSQLARAIDRARATLDQPWPLSRLAEEAGITPYQMDHRVRQVFHLTPGQLLLKFRMDQATQQLRHTASPIATVALNCGYSDQSAFTRQFRRAIGMSPGEYRRMHKAGVE